MTELQEKINKLPTWVRRYIHDLETRSSLAIEETARTRRKVEIAESIATRHRTANEALLELLNHAGQAELDWAATVVKVLEGYEIFQFKERGNQ